MNKYSKYNKNIQANKFFGFLRILCLLFIGSSFIMSLHAQNPVNVITIATPPVDPVMTQYINSGKIRVTLTSLSPNYPYAYARARIERLSPSPFTINTNSEFRFDPQLRVNLTTHVPATLTTAQMLGAFGNFNIGALTVNGISWMELMDGNNNFRLPEGTYRICYIASEIGPNNEPIRDISDPNGGCATFVVPSAQPQGGVIITTRYTPPANPDFIQAIQSGKVASTVLFNSPLGNNVQVKLFGKIESVSPKPFSIALDPAYFRQPSISLSPNVPLNLTAQQIADAFGNFNEAHLVTTGITLNELKDANNNFKLPEGIYRMCLYARYDVSGSPGGIASNENLGCVNFNICYKAGAPQFTQPVSNFNVNNNIGSIRAASPVIFTWTPPNSTCGLTISNLNYDFEIRALFPSQTITDAINNPPVFIKRAIIPATFLLDTLLYKDVLQKGRTYVIRVKANTFVNSPVEIDNNGYSRVEAFIYGDTSQVVNVPVSGNSPITPPSIVNIPQVKQGNCSCASDISSLNKNNNNQSLAVGGSFQMASLTIKIGKLNTNGTKVSGDGTISINGVPVQVSFSDVVVNSTGVAIEGRGSGKTANGFDFLKNAPAPTVSTDHYDSFLDQIKNYNLAAVKNSAGISLPFGLKQAGLPDQVNVGIVALNITPTQASYNAIAVVRMADANNVLSLLAKDVCFTNSSFMCGDALFTLGNDFQVPAIQLNMKGYRSEADPGTYVLYSNNEMKQFRIHAEYVFPGSSMKKADGSELRAELKADAKNWSDWTATVSMDPFVVSSLDGAVFSLTSGAIYDHSTTINPPGMPASFSDAALAEKNAQIGNPLWMGFYVPAVRVLLPSIIKDTKKKDSKLEISATNLIIDKMGITGVIGATNVVNLNDGSLAGWYCSLDNISIKFLNSSYKEGGLYGKLIMPFSDKDKTQSQIDYSCTLSASSEGGGLTYQFVAKQKNDIDFSAWWANFTISQGSIMVSNTSGKTVASANLSGSLNIQANIEGYKADLKLIKVEELQIKTEGPDYVKVKNAVMGFSSPQHSFSGFPINIKNVRPDLKGSNVGLLFDIAVALSDIDNKLLPDAVTTLRIGADVLSGERSVWKRTSLELSEVKVKGTVAGVVHVDGSMKFFKDDPVFGNGIQATLKDVYFTGLESVKVSANAKFGSTTFNYWYFDASVTIPPIPVAPGLSINGFGGGAYYNLEKDPQLGKMLAKDYFKNMAAYKLDSYKPKSGILGFNAKIAFCSSDGGALYSGFGELGMSFDTKGSFSLNTIDGQLYLQVLNLAGASGGIAPVDDNAPIRGVINIHIGIPDKVFGINGGVEIDAFGILKGRGSFALLADVGQNNYYIKLGVPDDRIAVSVLDLATLQAYFMAGNKLDVSIPDPDPSIVDVSELKGYSKMSIPTSGGLAFGASLSIRKELKFFPFKIEAHAGLGFDISLARATSNCEGAPAGSLPGINGWYAMGQVYAGIGGRFSLFVDIFFFTGEVEIAELNAAVLLRGGLPNPAWFEGYALLKYDVLDGLVAGDVNFKVAIGDKCELSAKVFEQPLIADLRPANNTKDVRINAYIEADFNYPMEKEFQLVVINSNTGKSQARTFRIQLENCKASEVKTGKVFANYWDSDSYGSFTDARNTRLIMSPESAMQPQTDYIFSVTAKAQEKISMEWQDSYYKNAVVRETKEVKFKSGDCKLDEYITSKENRIGAYPFPGQRYFLPGESKQGALILDRNYSCANTAALNYSLVARFTVFKDRSAVSVIESPVKSDGGKYLRFDIPTLPNESLVQVEIIKRMNFSAPDSRNIKLNTVFIKNKTLDAVLYTYHFKTSKYNTLAQKLKGIQFDRVKDYLFQSPFIEMRAVENFDEFDVNGFKSSKYQGNEMFFTMPLVLFRESPNLNRWSKNHALTCVYNNYTKAGYNVHSLRQQDKSAQTYLQIQFSEFDCAPGLVNCVPLSPIEITEYDAPLSIGEIRKELPLNLSASTQIKNTPVINLGAK